MTHDRTMFTGLAALAMVLTASAITTASAAPGDGPREVRAKVMEKQSALPRVAPTNGAPAYTAMTNTTITQAVNIAQAATRGFVTSAAAENRPDGSVVVVDVTKDGVNREVVVNRQSSNIERVTLADHDRAGEATD